MKAKGSKVATKRTKAPAPPARESAAAVAVPAVDWSPETIRAFRARLDMTQEEFGAALEVHGGTIKKWEGGRAHPRAKQRRKMRELATAHGVTLSAEVATV